MRTQFELLNGRTMAERVASALKLGEDQDFFRPRNFSITGAIFKIIGLAGGSGGGTANKSDREGAAAGIVLGNRAVRPVMGSRLVDIDYSDPNPSRAQRIASAYADAFVASNLDKRFQANSYAKVFLEDQLKTLKLRLEDSEKALIAFGQKEEIVATNDKASIAETNLANANAALGVLISDRIKNEQLWKQLDQATAINLPQLLTNPVIESLRTKRNTLSTEYQDKLETFKPSYPEMMQLSSQIAEIDRQLATELKTLKASYKAAYELSLSQENEMKRRVETLKADMLDLQKRSIEYNILKREVDTNRSLYDGLLQRFKEVDIAGGVGANNVFIVDKATLPGSPSSPNLSRALIMYVYVRIGRRIGAGVFPRTPGRHRALARGRRADFGTGHARHHSEDRVGQDHGSRIAGSAVAYVGSLSLAVHGAAAVDRERSAEDAAGLERRSGRGQVDHRADGGAALCQGRHEGSADRRRYAQADPARENESR